MWCLWTAGARGSSRGVDWRASRGCPGSQAAWVKLCGLSGTVFTTAVHYGRCSPMPSSLANYGCSRVETYAKVEWSCWQLRGCKQGYMDDVVLFRRYWSGTWWSIREKFGKRCLVSVCTKSKTSREIIKSEHITSSKTENDHKGVQLCKHVWMAVPHLKIISGLCVLSWTVAR